MYQPDGGEGTCDARNSVTQDNFTSRLTDTCCIHFFALSHNRDTVGAEHMCSNCSQGPAGSAC